ncbi:primosomal protein [Nostocales cyanobacterium HT-58-2]|nr:primosomal protein [Nostocales cyanobacterium HT-58-2]
MAKAIERIERDLLALEEAIGAIAKELQSAYANYLTALGQTVRKQLTLATYHLCTQGYPEDFLSLSLNQRQQLQQATRKLGQQTAEQLQALLKNEQEQQEEIVTDEAQEEEPEDQAEEEKNEEITEVGETYELSTPASPNSSAVFSLSSLHPVSSSLNMSNPAELAKWQQNIERATQQKLKIVSRKANLLLQKAGILPKKLPEQILEAAAAAASEASAEVMPGPPNLLNLVIEIENEQQSEDSGLTQIMAINLRLGEIEFADATLSSHRKQIRSLLVQLSRIGQEYQKKQRERSVAQAEAAWRAIWSDD